LTSYGGDVDGHAFTAIEAALATSAVPGYFAPAKVGNNHYIDGGLYAVNPELVLWEEATAGTFGKRNFAGLLSVGTASSHYGWKPPRQAPNITTWVRQNRLILTMFSARAQHSSKLMAHLLGERYLCLDSALLPGDSESVGFDKPQPEFLDKLEKIARKRVSTALAQREFRPLGLNFEAI
jgi:predicted acylesterase/phospholipase RssA